ncbi:hypothetical protein H0O02_04545 [Candidatus Micrarchaeota archaeon]|nr:hypothetical protein [Candidatus Micrarchaeota archaeon]
MDTKKISTWLLALAAFLLILGMAYLYPPVEMPQDENAHFEYSESPLYKNADLMLGNGERYFYNFSSEGMYGNATFTIEKTLGCTYVMAEGLKGSGACLNGEGNDQTGSNVSFSDPDIFMFRPWMLAVNDTWKWNASVYSVSETMRAHVFDIEYRTVRTDILNGRRAYVVEINTGNAMTVYQWIDAEKRILLKEMGSGVTIELEKGPEP